MFGCLITTNEAPVDVTGSDLELPFLGFHEAAAGSDRASRRAA